MTVGTISDIPSPPLTRLNEDEELFRSTVRDFARETVGPLVRQMDEEQHFAAELLPQLFSLGLMGIEIPAEYGGSSGTFFEAILAVEEISAIDASVGVLVDVQNTLCVNAFLRWGTEEQKRKYLPRMAADTVAAYALSEAASGSDAFALQARAEKRGDEYVLNGQKLWITNAKEAGIFIVFATLDTAAGYKGITAFIVEKDFPGFTVGKKEDKLGIRASSTCELILEDCRVPASNVLGEPGKGYKIAIETLNEGRIGIGAQMLESWRRAHGTVRRNMRWNASNSAKPSLNFRRYNLPLRKWRPRSKRRGYWCITRRGSRTLGSISCAKRRWPNTFPRRLPSAWRAKPLRSMAATDLSKIIQRRSISAMPRSERSTKARRICSWRRSQNLLLRASSSGAYSSILICQARRASSGKRHKTSRICHPDIQNHP